MEMAFYSKPLLLVIKKKKKISSVQSHSHVRLFATLWTVACQASLSITNSQSLLKFMTTELVMSSNHLILCHPLLLLPSIFPSISGYLHICVIELHVELMTFLVKYDFYLKEWETVQLWLFKLRFWQRFFLEINEVILLVECKQLWQQFLANDKI